MSSRHLSIPADGGIQMPQRHCDICGVYTDNKCSYWTRSNCKNRNQDPPRPAQAKWSWQLFWFVVGLAIIVALAVMT